MAGVTRGMGFNVHWASAEKTRGALERYTAQSNPGVMLYLDRDHNAGANVRALAARYPNTIHVRRKWLDGDHQNQRMTPAQFIAEITESRDAPPNYYESADNEPNPTQAAGWLLEVAERAKAARVRVSLGGFGTGQPSDAEIELYAPLLRFMAANPGVAVIDLHEYVRALWTVDFARDAKRPEQWPSTVPGGVALHLMGRFRKWLALADRLGVAHPPIVIGEWTWDRVEAVPPDVYGDTGGVMTCLPVWQSWGVGDPQLYGARQLQAAWGAIYQWFAAVKGVAAYQWSDDDSPNWALTNFALVDTLTAETAKGFDTMNAATPTPPTVTPYALGEYTLKTTQTHVNLRNAMSGDTGDILNGAPVTVLSPSLVAFVLGDKAYKGQYVRAQTTTGVREGYLLRPAAFTLEAVIPDPGAGGFVARMRAGIAKVRADLDALTALVDEYESGL